MDLRPLEPLVRGGRRVDPRAVPEGRERDVGEPRVSHGAQTLRHVAARGVIGDKPENKTRRRYLIPYAADKVNSPLNLRIRHAVRELLLGQAQGVRRVLDAAHQDLAHRALHGDLLLLRRLREIRVLARARGGFLWVDKTRKGQSNCAYFYENKDDLSNK